ncbi:ATP-binding protein [Saccharopolyspora taberi]|uniref:LuxR family transcriptional regulator n=1 Tax=Saccharopolyspora taberi TaxID=60895 RepID=A0ABN3V4M2_9PSEU
MPEPQPSRGRRPARGLVGRADELRRLVATVARRPSVALVEGEAGIGKTRLVRELLDAPELARHAVLLGHCHPIREPFPYGPVLEVLLQAGDRYPAPERLNPVVGALRPYLPELAHRLPPALDPLPDPSAERHRLFRAVRELLATLGPAVLVVEDLHWADDGSRDLLRFLVDGLPDDVAAVLTYRREDLPGRGLPFGQAYRHPVGTTSAVIALSPLDRHDTATLAASILGRPHLPPELATRLHDRTAGIPFVMEELLCSVAGDPEALDDVEVPLLLREAMADRMATLPAATVTCVRAAAVLRTPATEELLTAVGGLEPAEGRVGIKEAQHGAVLHEQDDGRYGFRHALAQQAVYDSLPGPVRRDLHRRAMAALTEQQPVPLVQLSYHARQAGDLEAWLRHGESAADRAGAVGDTAIAVEVLETLLSDPLLPGEARARLAVKLSRAAVIGLSHRRVVGLLRRVLDVGDLPEGVRGEVRLNLGLLLMNQAGEVVTGLAEIQHSVAELRERPALAARAMAALAHPNAEGISITEHERWLERAEQLATRQENPVVSAAVLCTRLTFRMGIADPTAWEEVRELPEQHCSVAIAQQVSRGYGNLTDACTWLGHYAAAQRFMRNALDLAQHSGNPLANGMVEGTRLRLDWALGRWEGLAERAGRFLETTAYTPPIAGDARLVLGLLAIAVGEWDRAAEHLRPTGPTGNGEGDAPLNAAVSGALARLLVAQGDVAGACAEVDRAVNRLRHKGVWVWAGELGPSAVAALVRGGRSADAHDLTAEFAAGIAGTDSPLADAAREACEGVLALAEQRHLRAAELFFQARAGYAALPRPYSAARAGEAAARCRLAAGKPSASEELRVVIEEFTALGATRDAARCRRVLRGAGMHVPSNRGRRGYGAELSPREREVAQLLAKGRTNREIAEVLFLSTRTVEQHVARVLRKLQVTSRRAVGESLVGHDL